MIKEHVSFTCGLMKAKHVICRQFKYASWLYGFNHKNIKSNKQSRSSRRVMNQKEVRSQKKKKNLSDFLYSRTKWVSWLDEETVSLVQCLIISLFLKNFLNERRTITKIKMITVCSQIFSCYSNQVILLFYELFKTITFFITFAASTASRLIYCYGLVQEYNT